MTTPTRVFIAMVIAAGSAILLWGVADWQLVDPQRFVSYLLLTAISATFKVRMPGIPGTYSLAFLFVLIGIASLPFSQTLIVGCASSVAQSFWRPKRRPKAVQVALNVAAIALTIGLCFAISRALPSGQSGSQGLVIVGIAAPFYYAINTGLAAGIISLFEKRAFSEVWRQWLLGSFPYYVAGAIVALLFELYSPILGWSYAVASLPIVCLIYLYFQSHKSAERSPSVVS